MDEAASVPAGRGQARDENVTADAVAYLRTLGAEEIEHPGGTLLQHLRRVSRLLESWGARRALQLAGLCHAFYGTDGFAPSLLPLDSRDELARRIGGEAEEIVYFYASCDRKVSYRDPAGESGTFRDRFTGRVFAPDQRHRRDFAELTAANELDLADSNPAFRTEWGDGLLHLLTRLRPLLSAPAWDHTRKILT